MQWNMLIKYPNCKNINIENKNLDWTRKSVIFILIRNKLHLNCFYLIYVADIVMKLEIWDPLAQVLHTLIPNIHPEIYTQKNLCNSLI